MVAKGLLLVQSDELIRRRSHNQDFQDLAPFTQPHAFTLQAFYRGEDLFNAFLS